MKDGYVTGWRAGVIKMVVFLGRKLNEYLVRVMSRVQSDKMTIISVA
jgi:hypothetical protein